MKKLKDLITQGNASITTLYRQWKNQYKRSRDSGEAFFFVLKDHQPIDNSTKLQLINYIETNNTPKIIIPKQWANIDARKAYKEYIQG